MPKIPPRPSHDAPRFPLSVDRAFGGGLGNAALNAWHVRIPSGLPGVRVWDWTHPLHLDVPIMARVCVQTWKQTPEDFAPLGAYAFQTLRGVLTYSTGQQKVREVVGIPANGWLFRTCAREITLDLFRNDEATGLPDGVTDLIASVIPEDYQPVRTRQGALFDTGETYAPLRQQIPVGATRYRASVSPWGSICAIEFYDLDLTLLDTVPALSVPEFQALPTSFGWWAQDAASMQSVNPGNLQPLVTLEFE